LSKGLISLYLTILLSVGVLLSVFVIHPVKAGMITVPDDFSTIQEAINHANEGDTIFVRNGTYYEHVLVNKTVTLVGEDKQITNIDGNNTGNCVTIQSNGAVLKDFTIENGKLYNIRVGKNVSQVVIDNNFVIDSYWGIHLGGSLNSTIKGNLVKHCRDTGLFLESSSYNTIIGNTLVNNHQGIVLAIAPHIPEIPPVLCVSNTVYYNNLLNNSIQAVVQVGGYVAFNRWDNGYRFGGNYWSNYNGTDSNQDGIGDAPYAIDTNNQDRYPLMDPWKPLLGDINDDRVVDILDIVAITSIYGCKEGELKWNPEADLAPQYGRIDILDLVTCTSHYGEKYH